MATRQYYVYITANKRNTVLYTGVTSDLQRRTYEHKNGLVEGFTHKYGITKLVYFEAVEDVRAAISREKQIKAGSRQDKVDMVSSVNHAWRDLYEEL